MCEQTICSQTHNTNIYKARWSIRITAAFSDWSKAYGGIMEHEFTATEMYDID